MDKEALVILTIFADQYPFMLLLMVQQSEVAAAVICSFTFDFLYFSFPPFFLLLTLTDLIQRVSISWVFLNIPLRAASKDLKT